jgi:hypothetical protein
VLAEASAVGEQHGAIARTYPGRARQSASVCANIGRRSLVEKEGAMPQYVILADHTPDICPSANARSRARALEGTGELLPKLAAEAGITFQVGPLHLDPGHRTVSVVDAPSIEAVTKLVYDTGLSQWNTVEVCPTTPIAELMADVDRFPIVFE